MITINVTNQESSVHNVSDYVAFVVKTREHVYLNFITDCDEIIECDGSSFHCHNGYETIEDFVEDTIYRPLWIRIYETPDQFKLDFSEVPEATFTTVTF